MGVVQVPFVRPGSTHRTIRHLPFINMNMNFITVILSVLFLATAVKAETFAEKLAVFIGDTPAGYTVSQMVKNGETCHCRVPGSSSSSSSQFVSTTAAASSVLSLTTELDTPTDATTTDATTTDATTTDTTTAGTTTGTTTGGSSSALTADFDTAAGSAGR